MVHLIGRVTRQAIVRETSNDKKVLNFTIALNDYYKDKEGKKVEQVTYINCSYWRNPDSVVKYMKAGVLLEVTGRLSAHAYLNSDDEPVGQIDLNINNFTFLTKGTEPEKPSRGKRNSKDKSNTASQETTVVTDPESDLPF